MGESVLKQMTVVQKTQGTLRDGVYIKSVASRYSPTQLSQYLNKIGFKHTNENDFPVENLERLIRLHLLTFPFENTELHYEPGHTMDLDPQRLFDRFVVEGKGSYCCGQNSIFLNMLRALGYRAYNVIARVNEVKTQSIPQYGVHIHLFILVQPIPNSNITYVVDVGFGTGPVRPILLSDSRENIVDGVTPTEKFRITRGMDLRSSLESKHEPRHGSHQNWIMQVQRDKDQDDTKGGLEIPWTTLYSFSEDEFYEKDIAVSSLGLSKGYAAGGFFRDNVIITKFFLLDACGNLNLIYNPEKPTNNTDVDDDVLKCHLGRVTLFGKELKFTFGGKSETKVISTESERIKALKKVFGIVVGENGKQCIQGLPSAIGGDT